ncbi:glycosyltransferase family 4 protein [Vibrio metoecus]|uniref:glycosyltransferase family 4 protein n=1 Tax=Vibrio metoecus TaxID=1481663 RepID=UPI000BA958F1|nr:glycosyltransferase family 4 protein [Vibrio metoecus]PAR35708.1 glycosyl transferase family 1 [Vibrio metoecus]PAR44194.1 glycosyl transferase family 1 [Vibrio metoecus]
MKKLHILHTESSCGWGGQEIRILTESEGMMAKGHQVTIACPAESNIYRAAQQRGIPVFSLPIQRKNFKGLRAISSFLSKHKFDVINTHSSTDSWLVSLTLMWRRHRPGIVRTRHLSTTVHNNLASRWLYLKGNDFLVTTGEKLRQTLHRDNGIPLGKMRSVPTGIDAHRFTPCDDKVAAKTRINLPADKTIVGILATIRTWKGHEYLLHALDELKRHDYHLLIVGDGPNRANVESCIDDLQLRSQVTLVGNQDDVVPYLQAMDLFCLPSYGNEGVPQGIMQAMLCRLPIISTDVGSILEVLHPHKNGFCVPTKNSKELAEALKYLLEGSVLREQFAEYSYHHALAHCTLDKMVDEMEEIFIQVAR